MNQDEIIEIAKQAGFFINDELTITSPFIEDICISPMLKKFAKLVAAKERDEIAEFIERTELGSLPEETALHYAKLLRSYSTAIRARGEA